MRNTNLPRLTKAIQYAAILSYGEAQACILNYRNGSDYSSEAVNHYGGTRKVITNAIKLRRYARDAEARRRTRAAERAGLGSERMDLIEEARMELGLSDDDTFPI